MDQRRTFHTYEAFIFTAILLALTIVLVKYNTVRYYSLGTDSAGFVDLIRVVAENGTMVSPIFSSFYSAIPLLAAPPEIYCTSALVSVHQSSSYLQWHPYFVTYLLAVPVKYFGATPLGISAIVNAINIAGSLSLIYWFLRRKGLAVWECLSFIFAVAISQYWVGTIIGQFYYDRLFILPGLVLVLFCYERWDTGYRTWLAISLIAMLSSILISERTALLASVLTLGYWVLMRENRFKGKGITLLFFSISGLVYLTVYMKFFQNSLYYNGLGWRTILYNLSLATTPGSTLFNPTMMWIGIVLPMVILSFVNWRYGLLVLATLTPNLLVTVGGGEKIGFTTHYHAGYIPFLVGFAAIGFATLVRKVRASEVSGISWTGKHGKPVAISIAVVLSGVVTSQFGEACQAYATMAGLTPAYESMVKKKNGFTTFFSTIPKDVSVSSPEWTMPILGALGRYQVDYMPIGIGINPYVIAHYDSQATLPEVPSYLDPKSKERIASCIQDKLAVHYRVKSEALFDGSRYIIYEKSL